MNYWPYYRKVCRCANAQYQWVSPPKPQTEKFPLLLPENLITPSFRLVSARLCCCGHHFLHFVNCCSFTNFWMVCWKIYQIEPGTFSNIFDPSHYCSTNECQLMSVKFPMHNDRKLFSFPLEAEIPKSNSRTRNWIDF